MKSIILTILLFFVSSATGAEVIDIDFLDSSNRSFRTVTLSADLKSRYGGFFEEAKVLLIEVPSLSSKEYLAQDKSMEALGHEAEELQVLFVAAFTQEECKWGYRTTPEVARKLAAGMTQFRVPLLDSLGNVLQVGHRPLSVDELRRWLGRRSE
jgi:hypothetical protein